jgi:hypothetical protein
MSATVPHLPALRWGEEYPSLTALELRDHRTGVVVGRLSQVNAGSCGATSEPIRPGELHALRQAIVERAARGGPALPRGRELPLGGPAERRGTRDARGARRLPLALAREIRRAAGELGELDDPRRLTRGLASGAGRGRRRAAGIRCGCAAVPALGGAANNPSVCPSALVFGPSRSNRGAAIRGRPGGRQC